MLRLAGVCPALGSGGRQVLPGARLNLSRGDRARFAMAFTSLATSLDTPTADLDLVIAQVDPQSGNVIRLAAWSGQIESTLEMVEFRAEASGTYQAFISARSCRRAPWYLGYAWNAIP